jgi:hypothetical protein
MPQKQIGSKSKSTYSDEEFDHLIPKLRPPESIHPLSTASINIPEHEEFTQVDLTELDSFPEFAWEFLRRNRFYQALIDTPKTALPASAWGFMGNPNLPRTHGLSVLKPYRESYTEGEMPEWLGIDTFAARLPTSSSSKPETISIDLQPGQVALVFDVSGLLNGHSPLQIQLDAARQRLWNLSETEYQSTEMRGKLVHRKVLVRRLKMLKLLEEGKPFESAARILDYKMKTSSRKSKSALSPFARERLASLSQEPVTTAYEDAVQVYNYVYRHGYMDLIREYGGHWLEGKRFVPLNLSKSFAELTRQSME